MSTSAALPFARATNVAAGGASRPTEEVEGAMSITRIGLFFIAALSIGIIVVAVINLRMGAKKVPANGNGDASSDGGGDDDVADDDDSGGDKTASKSYPNLTRDYIVLAASVLTFIVSAASIYMSFPNKG